MDYPVGYEMPQPVDYVDYQIDPAPKGNGLPSQLHVKIQLFSIDLLH